MTDRGNDTSQEKAGPPFVDELLPYFDVESSHSIIIVAPIDRVYEAARRLDLSASLTIRLLFRLRGMPSSALNAQGLAQLNFKPLLEASPRGFVLGLAGQFWTPSGHLLDFEPATFATLQPPGFARAIWSFDLVALSPTQCRLRTITRVCCTDEQARDSFRRYWRFVGPFSGLIRRRMLKLIKRAAEDRPAVRAENARGSDPCTHDTIAGAS